MPPMDLGSHQRLYTPPVVPASQVGAARRAQPAAVDDHVMVLAGGAAGASGRAGEEMVDLVYDPVLNCYYDTKAKKYYELK
eukprot:359052-Chlamydomonas_euryale.AAC.2